MPALLSIRQFESAHHVFVNSKDYPATCMRAFIGPETYTNFLLTLGMIEPFMRRITELAKQFPEKHESESI